MRAGRFTTMTNSLHEHGHPDRMSTRTHGEKICRGIVTGAWHGFAPSSTACLKLLAVDHLCNRPTLSTNPKKSADQVAPKNQQDAAFSKMKLGRSVTYTVRSNRVPTSHTVCAALVQNTSIEVLSPSEIKSK